tara:strand:- start:2184 stop:2516 length:333 start_codon:yes stop_codon:yes gene_type:complete
MTYTLQGDQVRSGVMNTPMKISLPDIRIMILCGYPLSTEECGHQHYDGEGVKKSLKEAYVWYRIAQCAGNNNVDSLVNYLNTKLIISQRLKLSSRAKQIYASALRYEYKA